MTPTEYFLDHGYIFLFAAILAEQIGLPFPSMPVLVAAGALAGSHRLNLPAVLAVAVTASLISDSVWYLLGRRRGGAILGFICRLSLEPDTCVSNMHSAYSRYGPKSLLFAKFVPGLGTLGPPMAGMLELAPWKFVLLDAGGALAWSGGYVALGWIFRTQLKELVTSLARFGTWFGIGLAFALGLYVGVKYIKRRRIYGALRIARITPVELRKRMDANEKLTIVDLRNPMEWRDGWIPGSLQFSDENLDSLISTIDQTEVILYCSCPREAQSARAALRLKRRGVGHVRPLEGGFVRWRELGFPVEIPAPQTIAAP